MDDTTRGVGRGDEFKGRGDETTRNYATEPGRTPAAPPAARPTRSTEADSSAGLDPESERRTREIQGDIAHTRAELSETIDALQEKLRPGNIMSEATDKVKTATTERVRSMADTVSDTAYDVMEGARQNPIPALMIGAGVAWMLIDRSRQGNGHAQRERSGYASRRYGAYADPDEYYRSDVERGEGRPNRGLHTEGLSNWTREAADEARQRARRAQNGFQRILRQNPLLVGAAAMLVGAAVGASLPETERENELMGETRDSLVDRAQHMAENATEAVKEAANETVGDTVSKVAEKVTSKRS